MRITDEEEGTDGVDEIGDDTDGTYVPDSEKKVKVKFEASSAAWTFAPISEGGPRIMGSHDQDTDLIVGEEKDEDVTAFISKLVSNLDLVLARFVLIPSTTVSSTFS